jgi:hypothetical protein
MFSDLDDETTKDEQEGEVLIIALENYFFPSEIISISIYEEDHPNKS